MVICNPAWSYADSHSPVRNSERSSSGSYSAKLTTSNPLGPWKTVKVNKGDVITVAAYGSYPQAPTNNTLSIVPYVDGIQTQSQTTESGNHPYRLKMGIAVVPIAVGTIDNTVPKAYLQYILTDSKGNVTHSKLKYISAAANNAWESMSMVYTAETEGYLQVFVANESDRAVWFDEVQLTVNPGLIVQETHYDPRGLELAGIEGRGSPEHRFKFQGKELTDEIALYLMDFHARQYDPQLGRWHATDPQDQFASPYLAMGNNPVMKVDPDWELAFIPIAAATYFLFFTETGYDVQKYLSPVAVNIDVKLGTHQRGIGFNTSVGVPQINPVSYRGHGGASYYWKNYDVTPGWETRYGAEWGLGPVTVGGTRYNSPGTKFDQTLGHLKVGVPGLNVKYANDHFFDLNIPLVPNADGGDRYRTAALKMQAGIFDIGINLFTGDPGLRDRETDIIDGNETYVFNPRTGNDPDEFRAGVGYIGIGPFRFGNDRERRRHKIQNEIVHRNSNPPSPYFRVLNVPNKRFFQFGGGGLW